MVAAPIAALAAVSGGGGRPGPFWLRRPPPSSSPPGKGPSPGGPSDPLRGSSDSALLVAARPSPSSLPLPPSPRRLQPQPRRHRPSQLPPPLPFEVSQQHQQALPRVARRSDDL